MRYVCCILLICSLSSCFLLNGFRKDSVKFSNNGVPDSYSLVVPRRYDRKEWNVDSAGNESLYYHYKSGAFLYFVHVKDTSVQYIPIDYSINQPMIVSNALFYKGIDSANTHYWRESRAGKFKAGYYNAPAEVAWRFDSSLNYFSMRLQ